MTGRGLAALTLVVTVSGVMQAKQPAAPQEASAVLAAYAAGDDLAVERWVRTLPARSNPLNELAAARRPAPWTRSSRTTAAFLLEVAVADPTAGRAVSALDLGRRMVMSRPTPLGNHPEDDRFEVLWHQTALAIIQAHLSIGTRLAYLSEAGPRLGTADTRGPAMPSRLPLARAVAAAACCDGHARPDLFRYATGYLAHALTLDGALGYFDIAARQPELRDEAMFRSGKLLLEAGRLDEALGRLQQVGELDDAALAYIHHLTLGRVFDGLQRPLDARDAYMRALAVNPNGQLAAIGLAAANLRAGRIAEANDAARRARVMAPQTGRGFHQVQAGDGRFVAQWLAEVRRLRR